MRKKRLDLKLIQKDLAKKLGTTGSSIVNWETNKTYPTLIYMTKIMAFLGYWPYEPEAKSLGERIKKAREFRGLTLYKLGQLAHTDPTTIASLERGEKTPRDWYIKKLDEIFGV